MEATDTPPQPRSDAPRTPEEIERHWFQTVYQGDVMRQLTARAVIMGMLLGMVMACSNVYVGLKAGWSMGVAITSCILAYTIFAALHRAFPRLFPDFTILENNAMQSTASAAGSMTSAGLVNAIPALMMLNPDVLPTSLSQRMLWLVPWVIVISWLGVFLAVPTKRQLINIEQLPFPSGTAAAATLRSLHGHGEEAGRQARALGLAGALGGVITWVRDARASWLDWCPHIPRTWGTSWIRIGTHNDAPLTLADVTLSFEGSLLFVAAGAIMSFRQAWSLMLGAVINYGVLAPMMLNAGVIDQASFRKISSWSLWTGVPMMVTSGLLLFFMNWKSVVRAFSTIVAFFHRDPARRDDPMDRIEVPGSWFLFGVATVGTAAVFLGQFLFGIAWWMGAIAVAATFFLVVVAGRAVGETDITPVGPLSKITQLTFGAIKPGDVTTNLMTANITAGATSHAGDLLSDLKSGYLLGAKPRQQFLAQFFGVLAGGFVVVPVFFILIPDVSKLATEQWPAPAALVWRGVAELLAKGPGALHPTARIGLVVGGLLGILLPLAEMAFPRAKAWIPSATGIGLAFTINGFNSVSMFIGACVALWLAKYRPALDERYRIPVSSGIIAGESLMGVAIALSDGRRDAQLEKTGTDAVPVPPGRHDRPRKCILKGKFARAGRGRGSTGERRTMLTVTETARKKVLEILGQEGRAGQGLRVTAQAGGCSGMQYSLNFVEGAGQPDDVLVSADGFQVHLDPVSAQLLEGGTLDYLETLQGAGFKIDTPHAPATPPAKPEGPQAEAVQRLLDEVINPGVSSHGGYVNLVDVKDNVVFLRLGGGCQGCGMVDVTLKQGIEVMIKEQIPGIVAVYDVTDHADGKNPYYQPARHH